MESRSRGVLDRPVKPGDDTFYSSLNSSSGAQALGTSLRKWEEKGDAAV
jgi:hypothetical protein